MATRVRLTSTRITRHVLTAAVVAMVALFPGRASRAQSGPTCPCSIWSPSAAPTVASFPDPSALELGVKFRSDVSGFITGLRFYKGGANTGTHVGNLWTTTGTAARPRRPSPARPPPAGSRSTSPRPVPIAASTTYVASYHTDAGALRRGRELLRQRRAWTTRPLHALATAVDGANGVYSYGARRLPHWQLQRDQLLGRRGLQHHREPTRPRRR